MGRTVKVVLDTSALLYWTLDPSQLTEKAHRTLTRAEEILISSISIWEIALKVERGRLALPLSAREFACELEATEKVAIIPLDWPTWLDSVALAWTHRNPADRAIVALAQANHCPLLTSDREIMGFYPLATW